MNRSLQFIDGKFSLWTAHYGSWANDARIVFRVRDDNDPKQRAKEKHITNYDRLLPATSEEISRWIDAHNDLRPSVCDESVSRVQDDLDEII